MKRCPHVTVRYLCHFYSFRYKILNIMSLKGKTSFASGLTYLDIIPTKTTPSRSSFCTTGYPPWGVSNRRRDKCLTLSTLFTTYQSKISWGFCTRDLRSTIRERVLTIAGLVMAWEARYSSRLTLKKDKWRLYTVFTLHGMESMW